MKTLVLCRHAKSDWPEGVADINRPLKERGWNDAAYLGDLLGQRNFRADHIISSPAQRARSTAKEIAARIGYQDEIDIEETVYYQGSLSLIRHCKGLDDAWRTVMVFGHNPTMEETVRQMLQVGSGFYMPTCAMACLESSAYSWAKVSAVNTHLRWYLIPRFMRKNA
ncbi:MAG: histidine phosphatase family protein [Bacteroidota bacterium]